MLKIPFLCLTLAAVVGAAAVGRGHAGAQAGCPMGARGPMAEGHCPFAAVRAWLTGTQGNCRVRTVQAEATLLAAEAAAASGPAEVSPLTAGETRPAACKPAAPLPRSPLPDHAPRHQDAMAASLVAGARIDP